MTPKTEEPAAAGTVGGFGSKALGRACRTVLRRIAAAKRHRARSAARQREVVRAVVARQRDGGGR